MLLGSGGMRMGVRHVKSEPWKREWVLMRIDV
jgi:hypothetical protein